MEHPETPPIDGVKVKYESHNLQEGTLNAAHHTSIHE